MEGAEVDARALDDVDAAGRLKVVVEVEGIDEEDAIGCPRVVGPDCSSLYVIETEEEEDVPSG